MYSFVMSKIKIRYLYSVELVEEEDMKRFNLLEETCAKGSTQNGFNVV